MIGFSKPKGFKPFAEVIKLVECREYDHVYIKFQEPVDNEYMIFQASKSIVNLYNETLFFEQNIKIKEYSIVITDEQQELLWRFIKENLGIPYSLIEDFGILLMKVFKLKKQPFNRGKSAQFCSKLGASVCVLLGINIPDDVSNIDPSELDQILRNLGFPAINI